MDTSTSSRQSEMARYRKHLEYEDRLDTQGYMNYMNYIVYLQLFGGTCGVVSNPIPISISLLIQTVRSDFEQIPDHRALNAKISMVDALMSAFAMFSLKDSSLLEFDGRRKKDKNLRSIYGLKDIPSDTQLRTILDPVEPDYIRSIFKSIFDLLQKSRMLDKFVFMYSYYLV